MSVDWEEYYGSDDPNEISEIIDGYGMKTYVGLSKKSKKYCSTEEAAMIGCPEAIKELCKERERNMTPEQKKLRKEISERSSLTFHAPFSIKTMLDAVRNIEHEISYEDRQALEDEIKNAFYQHNKHMKDILNKCDEIKRKAEANQIPDSELPF